MSKRHKGFTILELLAVIAIMGILMAISSHGYRVVKKRAKISQAKSDFELIRNALEDFRAEYGFYPKLDPSDEITDIDSDQMDDLTNNVEQIFLEDPWGSTYMYERKTGKQNRYTYRLWSKGELTDDDRDDIY